MTHKGEEEILAFFRHFMKAVSSANESGLLCDLNQLKSQSKPLSFFHEILYVIFFVPLPHYYFL